MRVSELGEGDLGSVSDEGIFEFFCRLFRIKWKILIINLEKILIPRIILLGESDVGFRKSVLTKK